MTDDVVEDPSADKRMQLRYPGTCRLCGRELPARSEAIYERTTKTVRCVECPTSTAPAADTDPVEALAPPSTQLESGAAGSSARREYERRKARDEERLREKWGRLGGIAVALSDEKQTTKAWATGAVGEERLGARLDSLASQGIVALHDRRIPGSKANIDHIIITSGGVWVVDAKRYKGRPELKIEGGLLRPRVEKVMVGGRDCTKLLDGVLKQVDVVRNLLDDETVAVTGALCFVEADWPLIGGAFSTRGVQVMWPKRLAKTLVDVHAGPVDVQAMARHLASRLPSA